MGGEFWEGGECLEGSAWRGVLGGECWEETSQMNKIQTIPKYMLKLLQKTVYKLRATGHFLKLPTLNQK